MRTWLIRSLNPMLNLAGLRLARHSRFMHIITQLRAAEPNFCFLQIGANDGRSFDERFFNFVNRTNCRGVVIEPLTDVYEKLVRNYRHCERVTPLNVAVHPAGTKQTVYRVAQDSLSLVPPWAIGIASFLPEHHQRSGVPSGIITPVEVQCVHLMSLIERYSLNPLHLLQVDVEGFDAEVIRMIDFSRVRPKVIKYEHVNLQRGDLLSTLSTLKSKGYRCFREGPDTIAVLKSGLDFKPQ